MESHHNSGGPELQQRKAEPPECWQLVEKGLNGDAVGSRRQPSSEPGPHLVESAMQARSVVRSPEDLHLHPALRQLDCLNVAEEVNEAERVRHHAATPILITNEGTILSGFGLWRSALLHGEREIQCIEYVLGQEESLQFILAHQKPQHGWTPFVRTRLALTLEHYYQRRALDNMRDGGRYKGSASLPDLQRIDVRCKMAEIAGVGARNVSNVKIILGSAHPRLLSALANGMLTINKALALCKLPKSDQLDAFAQLIEDRAIDRVIRNTLGRSRLQEACPNTVSILATFQLCESQHPGSVVVRRIPSGRTTISVSNELLDKIDHQKDLRLHETA